MKYLKVLVFCIGLALMLFILGDINAQNVINEQNLQTLVVDKFDLVDKKDNYTKAIEEDPLDNPSREKGSWVVKYSRFRSAAWDEPVILKAGDANEKIDRENNRQWIRWLPNAKEGAINKKGEELTNQKLQEMVFPPGLPASERKPYKIGEREITPQIMGIKAKYDYSGFNWVVLEPANTRSMGEIELTPEDRFYASDRVKYFPSYIHMKGRVRAIDMWVWGCRYNYNLSIHVEDHLGVVHTLPIAALNYQGWRNLRVDIPTYIPQSQKQLPRTQPIKIIRLKITADPNERPDKFFVYFDYMQALTDLFEESYFGHQLEDPSLWRDGENKNAGGN